MPFVNKVEKEKKACKKCGGSGQVLGKCAMCNGTGKAPHTNNACQGCDGGGQTYHFCPSCGGTGETK